jgi:hypothetical protein
MWRILLRVLPLRAARQLRAPMGGLGTDSYTSSKHQAKTDLTPLPIRWLSTLPQEHGLSSSFLGAAKGDVRTPMNLDIPSKRVHTRLAPFRHSKAVSAQARVPAYSGSRVYESLVGWFRQNQHL